MGRRRHVARYMVCSPKGKTAMSGIIAIFVGGFPPGLSDIPYGCWAEKKADHEAWAIIGPDDWFERNAKGDTITDGDRR